MFVLTVCVVAQARSTTVEEVCTTDDVNVVVPVTTVVKLPGVCEHLSVACDHLACTVICRSRELPVAIPASSLGLG